MKYFEEIDAWLSKLLKFKADDWKLVLKLCQQDIPSFSDPQSAWEFVMPILEEWERSRARFLPEYRAGTWGPLEADRLIEGDGRQWRVL